MINKSIESQFLRRLQSAATMIAFAILISGCAPLKVNQRWESKPVPGFGKLFGKKQSLPNADPAGQSANAEASNSNVLTSEQAAQHSSSEDSKTNSSQLDLLRQAVDQVTPGQRQSNATPPPSQFTDREAMAHLLEVETQSAYEQGRYDAMQTGYQQPSDRTYTNPPHVQPSHPPQYAPPHMSQYGQAYQGQTYQGQTYQGQANQAHQGQPNQRLNLHGPSANIPYHVNERNSPPISNQMKSGAPLRSSPQMPQQQQRFQEEFDSYSNLGRSPLPQSQQQMRNGPPSGPEQRSRGISDGISISGTELRFQDQTATEIAIELEDKNAELLTQIKAKEFEILQMEKKADQQDQILINANALLNKSNRLAALLREKIAKKNVAIQDLEKEKMKIELNADRALKDIESNLDDMLMNSISSTQSK